MPKSKNVKPTLKLIIGTRAKIVAIQFFLFLCLKRKGTIIYQKVSWWHVLICIDKLFYNFSLRWAWIILRTNVLDFFLWASVCYLFHHNYSLLQSLYIIYGPTDVYKMVNRSWNFLHLLFRCGSKWLPVTWKDAKL